MSSRQGHQEDGQQGRERARHEGVRDERSERNTTEINLRNASPTRSSGHTGTGLQSDLDVTGLHSLITRKGIRATSCVFPVNAFCNGRQ
jgi:hypothetical protein